MRTTIDLPDLLFREVKSTAAARGLKLKDVSAESLREALDASGERAETNREELHDRDSDFTRAMIPSLFHFANQSGKVSQVAHASNSIAHGP